MLEEKSAMEGMRETGYSQPFISDIVLCVDYLGDLIMPGLVVFI